MEQKVIEKLQNTVNYVKENRETMDGFEKDLFGKRINLLLEVLNDCGSKKYTIKNWTVQGE